MHFPVTCVCSSLGTFLSSKFGECGKTTLTPLRGSVCCTSRSHARCKGIISCSCAGKNWKVYSENVNKLLDCVGCIAFAFAGQHAHHRELALLCHVPTIVCPVNVEVTNETLNMTQYPFLFSRGPMESQPKKETMPMAKRPDEWKDPWRRSKSPRRRPGLMGSPPRGRRRHRPSGSSVSLSNSSRYCSTLSLKRRNV